MVACGPVVVRMTPSILCILSYSGIIAMGPAQVGSIGASEDAKPYTQDQVATVVGFHGAVNVSFLTKVWNLFKTAKVLNYDHLWAIKSKMLCWAD